MPTATRTADPIGVAAAAPEAGAVGVHDLPIVVIDLVQARRRVRALREDFPWVDVHYEVSAFAHPALLAAIAGACIDAGAEVVVVDDLRSPLVKRLPLPRGRHESAHRVLRDVART